MINIRTVVVGLLQTNCYIVSNDNKSSANKHVITTIKVNVQSTNNSKPKVFDNKVKKVITKIIHFDVNILLSLLII